MSAFDKVIGYAAVKEELMRVCDYIKDSSKYEALGANAPHGVLLHGQPGLGKTLMAECFLEECGLYSVVCRKDMNEGSFVRNIKKCFDEAGKNAPSVVFLDDMDKYANVDRHHPNANEYVSIQSCIDNYKKEKVFVIATANDIDDLPSSLLRPGRFDHVIRMFAPTGRDAETIIRHYLKNKPVSENVDCKELAQIMWGKSCATLESVINEAAVFAGYEGKDKIDMSDIIEASLNIIFNLPKSDCEDKEFERMVALHEAGHIVVSEILQPCSISIASIRIRRNGTNGFVSFTEDPLSVDQIQRSICHVASMLAGRAAVEVCEGKIDIGATEDLDMAFSEVAKLVDDICFAGFKYHEDHRDYNNASETLHHMQELKIQDIITECYKHATAIIQSNRDYLGKLTNGLLKKKTLGSRDIKRIREESVIVEYKISSSALLR